MNNNNQNKPQDKKSQCNCCNSQDKNQGGQMKKDCGCMHHKNDQNRK